MSGLGQALDIGELVEALRGAGFRVDTRQHLTAHELLLACAARGEPIVDDPARVRSHLGPIFCTSPEEQRRFAEVVEALVAPAPPSTATAAPAAAEPFRWWRRWGRIAVPAAGVGVVALALAAFLAWYVRPVRIGGRVLAEDASGQRAPAPRAQVDLRGRPVALAPDGTFSVELSRAEGPARLVAELQGHVPAVWMVEARRPGPVELLLLLAPEPEPIVAASIRVGAPRVIPVRGEAGAPAQARTGILGGGALAAAALVLLAWAATERVRRRLVVARLPVHGGPELATLPADDGTSLGPDPRNARRVAAALRRPRSQLGLELDVGRSTEAAARAAGLATPVYAAPRGLPEYLALVERRTAADHQARIVEAQLDPLAEHGLPIDRYYYVEDPRVCFDRDGRRARRLSELLAHHHRAAVMVFGDARRFFDPLTGLPAPWVEALTSVPRFAVFTPVPPYRWSTGELRLGELGISVLPATAAGLSLFADVEDERRRAAYLFPAPFARPYPPLLASEPWRWLDRNPPPSRTLETLAVQLRAYLGPRGFAWLAACAVYPELEWPLTLHLGQGLPEVEDPAVRDETLQALARLPWFRAGFMPEWLRRTLIGLLTPAQEAAVRRRLFERLEHLARRALAEREGAASPAEVSLGAWVGPLDVARTAPPGSPMREGVFLAYLSGARVDAPMVDAPRLLRRLFKGRVGTLPADGRPDHGDVSSTPWRRAAAAAIDAAVVGALSAFFALLVMAFALVQDPGGVPSRLALPAALAALGITAWLYFGLGEASRHQATPGKRVLGLAVTDLDGRRIGFGRATIRFAAKVATLAPILALPLLIRRTPTLHDRLARTRVVRVTGPRGRVESFLRRPWVSRSLAALAVGGLTAAALAWLVPPAAQPATPPSVLAFAFHPDGKTVAVSLSDGAIQLVDLQSGSRTARLTAPAASNDVAFSPDGRLLAGAGRDGVVRVLEAATGRVFREIRTGGDLATVVFAASGSELVSVARGGRAWRTSVATGESVELRDVVAAGVMDGLLMVQHGDGSTSFLDPTPRLPPRMFPQGPVVDAAFGRGAIAALAGDGRIRVARRAAGWAPGDVLQAAPLSALALSPDGTVLSVERGREVEIWDVAATPSRGARLELAAERRGRLRFAADGGALATSTAAELVLWPVERRPAPAGCAAGGSTVYFGADGASVPVSAEVIVRELARCLLERPQLEVLVSGHTDDRGSREYLLALGQRYAQSTAALLRTLGVDGRRITTVSYAAERPVCGDATPLCWSRNRRVEFQLRERRTPAPTPRTVLWVDDNPANNAAERKALGAMGINVEIATSTDAALASDLPRYGAIITDMKRGNIGRAGYDLLDALRARNVLLPVIVYSSSSTPQLEEEARARGAFGETSSPKRLVELVQQALARKGAPAPPSQVRIRQTAK